MAEPRIGDAFGEMLLAGSKTQGAGVMEIVERDDGFISVRSPARYFAGPAEWRGFERAALDLTRGAVLDVGCGAGRFALALQDRGSTVTGLDPSPGAVAVSRERGVLDLLEGGVPDVTTGPRFDTFLLMGENLGLLDGTRAAGRFLAGLTAIARPGARIVGHGADPYPAAADPLLAGYLRRTPGYPGELPGEMTIRVRHRDLATSWFGYLLCSPDELRSLAEPAGWQLTSAEYADKVNYLAVLTRS